jgi:hypothetical protein
VLHGLDHAIESQASLLLLLCVLRGELLLQVLQLPLEPLNDVLIAVLVLVGLVLVGSEPRSVQLLLLPLQVLPPALSVLVQSLVQIGSGGLVHRLLSLLHKLIHMLVLLLSQLFLLGLVELIQSVVGWLCPTFSSQFFFYKLLAQLIDLGVGY